MSPVARSGAAMPALDFASVVTAAPALLATGSLRRFSLEVLDPVRATIATAPPRTTSTTPTTISRFHMSPSPSFRTVPAFGRRDPAVRFPYGVRFPDGAGR